MERKIGPAIWTNAYAVTYFFQALEGKDIKDLLTNVGSGGAAAPAAVGGAAAGAAAPAEAAAAEEKKEEGKDLKPVRLGFADRNTDRLYREGGVRRGHGLRSFRLSALIYTNAARFMRFGGGAEIWQLFSVWGVNSPIGTDQPVCTQAFRMQLRDAYKSWKELLGQYRFCDPPLIHVHVHVRHSLVHVSSRYRSI